jgi:hypothetical protein
MDPLNESGESELENLLRPPTPSPDQLGLRHTLLGRTLQVLRNRRRIKRSAMAAGMLACYAAGLATMALLMTGRSVELAKWAKEPSIAPVRSVIEPPSPPDQLPLEMADSDLPAAVLERLAESLSDDGSAELYRRAGDRHMIETGDLAAALRCYRRSLDAAEPEELTISEGDNWLIMSLKQARQEELRHAHNGG